MFDLINGKVSWSHFNPVRIACEPLESLANYAQGDHILLVTTPGFIKRGVVDQVKKILGTQKVSVWDGVKPNPDLSDLDDATDQLKTLKPDCIIGLGGGSALDAAKVLATTLSGAEGPTLIEVLRHSMVSTWKKRLPLIAIPTTAGTGSEVTPFATIWDHEEKKKYSLEGDYVFPDVALLDASLTFTLGRDDSLFPALDTVSHALESIWNINKTPISAGHAYHSMRLICNALPKILELPYSLSLRRDLQSASILSGLAISQTKTAIAHALSYPLTLYYGVPHGLACSFTLPYLIDKYIESSEFIDSHSLQTLISVKNMILELNLNKEMSKYVNYTAAASLIESQELSSRGKNYTGMMDLSVGVLIEKSMN